MSGDQLLADGGETWEVFDHHSCTEAARRRIPDSLTTAFGTSSIMHALVLWYGGRWHLWVSGSDVELRVDSAAAPNDMQEAITWANDLLKREDVCSQVCGAARSALIALGRNHIRANWTLTACPTDTVATCVQCGEVERSDEDRCCLMCGRDLVVYADRHSLDMALQHRDDLAALCLRHVASATNLAEAAARLAHVIAVLPGEEAHGPNAGAPGNP